MSYAITVELPPEHWSAPESASTSSAVNPEQQATVALIAQAQAGDRNAFNQLVVNTQGIAYNTAYRVLQDEVLAADAVQEAFLKAYRALGGYRGGSFKSWFLRILMNTCYDLLRIQKRQIAVSLDALPVETEDATQLVNPSERPETYAERMELRHWIERGIATLPTDQRVVLVLSDIEGYAYQEIGEMIGAPLGTVKSRLSRSRTALRTYLLRHKVLERSIGHEGTHFTNGPDAMDLAECDCTGRGDS